MGADRALRVGLEYRRDCRRTQSLACRSPGRLTVDVRVAYLVSAELRPRIGAVGAHQFR